jgi:hypothetical protein
MNVRFPPHHKSLEPANPGQILTNRASAESHLPFALALCSKPDPIRQFGLSQHKPHAHPVPPTLPIPPFKRALGLVHV